MSNTKRLTVTLSENTYDALRVVAAAERKSMGAVTRDLLDEAVPKLLEMTRMLYLGELGGNLHGDEATARNAAAIREMLGSLLRDLQDDVDHTLAPLAATAPSGTNRGAIKNGA